MAKVADTYEAQKLENLKKVLSCTKLNLSAIARLSGNGINSHTIQDWKRGKGLLLPEQAVALKTSINTIRINLKRLLDEFNKNDKSESGISQFKNLFKRDEIVWFVAFDRDRIFYRKIEGWVLGRRTFPSEEVQKLKSFILIFLTETTI